ncbi:monocarboxylate transporter 2-like [Rhipicephalus microplus]|uniref:monocarboxylate transporter 2-like n=1 Tax=Rhipicephalus microplus TaxID=6941 RepID=UPI003F6CC592
MGQRLYKTDWLDPLWPLMTDADAARKCYCYCKTLENLISEQANQRSVSETLFDRWLKTDVTMPRCWERWNNCSRMPQRGPDSVHSWLVAGACALSSFFAMAGRRSAGLLFVVIMQTFQVNRSEGSWPLMLMGAVLYLAGLITGPLAHRFNARPVIIAGAAIASAGSILCFFASTIKLMALTLGVIHAVGAGMVFIIAPTIISEHFIKNKGLAMGLNFTGVTLGLFVFPKLLEFLNTSYGLHGALLIFGAVCLNGLAFSLFLRTPSWRDISPSNNKLDPEIRAV